MSTVQNDSSIDGILKSLDGLRRQNNVNVGRIQDIMRIYDLRLREDGSFVGVNALAIGVDTYNNPESALLDPQGNADINRFMAEATSVLTGLVTDERVPYMTGQYSSDAVKALMDLGMSYRSLRSSRNLAANAIPRAFEIQSKMKAWCATEQWSGTVDALDVGGRETFKWLSCMQRELLIMVSAYNSFQNNLDRVYIEASRASGQ